MATVLRNVTKRWDGFCIVAATGPSLTEEVADACRGHPVIAVNDAYRLLPFAEVLYACDASWWRVHQGCPGFAGERWSSHGNAVHDNKIETAERYGVNLVRGRQEIGFCLDPRAIHCGSNSGFQGINLAIHMLGGIGRIALVGFDMRAVGGRRHFFGNHPLPLHKAKTPDQIVRYFAAFLREMSFAAKHLPEGLEIVNCTPGSAIECFPRMDLRDALPAFA